MSVWTHVNASIRFDGLSSLGSSTKPDLGHTCDFDSPEKIWDKCNVPCGSEGSLEYKLWQVGDGMVWYNAMIWGDLRSYDDIQEILDYLTRIIQGQMIRSGVAAIQCELKQEKNGVYEVNDDKLIWEKK